MGGSIGNTIGRVGLGAMTFGTSEVANAALGGFTGGKGPLGGYPWASGHSPTDPVVGGSMSPMQMLTTSGGAPLLANISMGADPAEALSSFLGLNVNKGEWKTFLTGESSDALGLDPNTASQVRGIYSQLNDIQSNTSKQTEVVNNLVKDFPNYMASVIPKYKGIADEATQAAAEQALKDVGAKYAAGGQLSSGATMEALAKTGASTAQQNLGFGTNLAWQDWSNKYNQASALQNFQQKMLGQGAIQGFNAIQNALAGNRAIDLKNAEFANDQKMRDQSADNAMWGSIGQLGGTAIGMTLGGPIGGMVGNSIGGGVASGNSGMFASPRLNLGTGSGYSRYQNG